jgi:alcohol dehydrogenase
MTDHAEALVLDRPRELSRRRLSLPEIGDDDGILRIEACGLCGTDHEQYTGHLPAPFGFIPGHEAVGIVEHAGDTALERWGVSIGDRVAVEVFLSCRECEPCRSGAYRRCIAHGLADMYGFIDVEKPPGLWGGYASHLYLAPDALLLPVPPALDPVLATVFNPLGAGIRWGVEIPETKSGDIVAVLGPGIRGLSAAAAAKSAGAGFVMVTGWGPRDAPRLAAAMRFGADLVVDTAVDDPIRALREATGSGADVVVDVTAKAPTVPGQALHLVRSGGTVVLAGTRGTPDVPGFDPDLIVYKEIRVLGALGVDAPAYRSALDLLAAGTFPFAELPRQVAGFDDIERLVQTMAGDIDEEPPIHAVFTPT